MPKAPSKPVSNGRIRRFPHIKGNWATLVYVPLTVTSHDTVDLADSITKQLQNTLSMCPIPADEQHISLSKPLFLKEFQIQPFIDHLTDRLRLVSPFTVHPTSYNVYQNDEKTTTFAALDCVGNGLKETLKAVDETALDFRLPTFYDPPQFHVSFAWSTDKQDAYEKIKQTLHAMPVVKVASFKVESLHAKIGNKLFIIPLG